MELAVAHSENLFRQTESFCLVHLQNGPCDEPCVTAHPFADSPLVTHRLSFSLCRPLKPKTEIKDLQI